MTRRYQPKAGPKWPDGPLLGLDLETGSPDPFTALPCSYALVFRRESGRTSIESNLVDSGVEIPAEATEIHGITTERARSEGMPLDDAAARLFAKLVWAEEEEIPVVGHNISYDLTIIDRLVGLDGWKGKVLDLFVLDKACDKYRKGSRKLSALAETYEVEVPEDLGGAHSAASDAATSILVLLAMAKMYDWLRRREPASLHTSQITWYRDQQESLSDYFVRQGDSAIPEYEWTWPIKRAPSPSPLV